MFTHEAAIEKRLERLLGNAYRVDIVEDEFVETLERKILAECKEKSKQTIYKRIEEQISRDRMLEACGYKVADLEDLSKRFIKRKKKIRRVLKTMPYIIPKQEREPEDTALEIQRNVVERESFEKQPEPEKKKLPLWYKVPIVNEMDDDKSIDELYRMADSIVWRRDLSEQAEIEQEVGERVGETEFTLPVVKENVSETGSDQSDAASEVSSVNEQSEEEEEEEKKEIIQADSEVVDKTFTEEKAAKKKLKSKSSVPITDDIMGEEEFKSDEAPLEKVDEEQAESSPTDIPPSEIMEEKQSNVLQANGEKEETTSIPNEETVVLPEENIGTAVPEEEASVAGEEEATIVERLEKEIVVSAPEETVSVTASEEVIYTEISSEIAQEAFQEMSSEIEPETSPEMPSEITPEASPEMSSEIAPEASPESMPIPDYDHVQSSAEQETPEHEILETIVEEMTENNKETKIERKENQNKTNENGIPSFDAILAKEAQKLEQQAGEEKPKIEDMVIAAVRERVSLAEEERMVKAMLPLVSIENDIQNSVEMAEIEHFQEKETAAKSTDSSFSENKSLEDDSENKK